MCILTFPQISNNGSRLAGIDGRSFVSFFAFVSSGIASSLAVTADIVKLDGIGFAFESNTTKSTTISSLFKIHNIGSSPSSAQAHVAWNNLSIHEGVRTIGEFNCKVSNLSLLIVHLNRFAHQGSTNTIHTRNICNAPRSGSCEFIELPL